MNTKAGQAYLSLRWNNSGDILDVPKTADWQAVKNKVLHAVPLKSTKLFKSLAVGLAKYDFYQGPENWKPEHKHEEFIIRLTTYAIEHKDAYAYDIRDICKSSRTGKIPDGFNITCDYCT